MIKLNRSIQITIRGIVTIFLIISGLNLTAQNKITVPFDNGFVGINTGNNLSDSCYYTNGGSGVGLGFTNVQFYQNSSSNVFVAQGNDIIGNVLIKDANGIEHSIPGFIKWRAPSGNVTTMVFQPSNSIGIVLATNGTNGNPTYTIDNLNYIGLTFNGNFLSIPSVPGVVTGNAATNGLLDALNSYLSNLPFLSIQDIEVNESSDSVSIPITLSAISSNDIKVSFEINDGTATQGLDYSTHTSPDSNTITFLSSEPTVLTKYIIVPIVLDTLIEFSEDFNIRLFNPVNSSIIKDSGVVTITDVKYLATNDTVDLQEGDTAIINVVLNDTMLGNSLDISTLSIYTTPTDGVVLVDTVSGNITFIPDNSFVGNIQFSYSICDTNSPASCDTATVFLTIKPSNSLNYTQIETDSTYSVCLDSITNLQGGVISSSICGSGNNGSLTSIGGHCYSYSPDSLFSGSDTICLIACNNDFCDTTDIIINVGSQISSSPSSGSNCLIDTINPTLVTMDTVVLYSDISGVIPTVDTSMLVILAWDNCTIDSVWNTVLISSSCTNDTTLVTTYIKDASDNLDSAHTVVIVLDTLAPVITCNDSVVYLDATGNVSFDTSYVLSSVADACLDMVWMSTYSASCANDTLDVRIYARDLSGNVDSCTSRLAVLDTISPTITCLDTTVYLDSMGSVTIDTSFVQNGFVDNCGVDEVWSPVFTTSSFGQLQIFGFSYFDINVNQFAGQTFEVNSNKNIRSIEVNFTSVTAGDFRMVVYQDSGLNAIDSSEITISSIGNKSFNFSNLSLNSGRYSWVIKPLNSGGSRIKVMARISNSISAFFRYANGNPDNYFQSRTYDAYFVISSLDPTYNCSNSSEQVTVYVRDNSGNIDSCVANVTVSDTIVPNLITKDTVVLYSDISGVIPTVDTSMLVISTWDNCTIDSVWNTSITQSCTNDTTLVKTYIMDGSGNMDSANTIVIVLDTLAPVLACNDSVVYLDANGTATYDTSYFINGFADACIDTVWMSSYAATCSNDTIEVTVYARDLSGNVDSCMSRLAVFDTILPTIACIDTTVYLDVTGSVTIDTSFVQTGFADNCGVDSVWSSMNTTFTCSDSIEEVTVYLRDNSGNIDSCVANVTVLDTIAPNLVAQNKTVYLDATGSVSFDTSAMIVSTHDNCSVDAISMDITSATCADDSVNVTLTITDVNGNSSTTMATVYVLDTIAPTVILANDTIYLNALGSASTSLSSIDNGSNDNCGIETLTLSDSTFSCSDTGNNVVTVLATDSSGNSSSGTSNVRVLDTISPMAMCKNFLLSLDTNGVASIVASDIDNGSSDNCGSVSLSASQTAFTCADLGMNSVTLTVTDGSGNTSTCIASVRVIDVDPPVALCQPATIYLDASGVATLAASDIDNGSSDNCSVSLSVSQTTFNCSDLGANTVTLFVIDSAGNTSTCTTTVTVLDTLAPMMVCQSVTVNLDALGNAMISASDLDNGSSDNCSGVTLSLSQTTFSCTDLGANMVTLTGTDASGNTSTCMATVTVVDGINPIALCKPATIYLDSNGDARLIASDIDNGSSDNCSVTVTITDSLFTCSDAGANNVTLTATDGDGNTSTCVAVVTVLDTISPIANCKADTLYLNAAGTASLTASMINDGSIDNCTFTMSVSQSTFTCSDMGVGSATLTVTDASGNISTCTSAITVMDTLAPMMSCTPVTIYLDAMGMATLTASQVDGGSTDNCGIATMSVSRSSFTCADMGTTTVTLTGTDASGNTSTCTTTVTILDTLAPVVLCKSATVVLDATGTATITTLDVDNGSTDNCGITLSLSNNTFNCTNVGANTVTLTGTDASGNTSSCTATVTVIDNMAPTAICQNITISLDGNGQATILANDIDAGSFDNCTVSGVTLDKTDFDCSNVGRNTVTLTVTDLYGNVSTCTATVTVEDNVAPVVFCPADKNRTVRNTTCTYVVEDFAWETTNTDNCTANGTTTEQFPAAGTEVVAENGRVTITIVTRDASMNADSCTFDVIVNCERELDIPEFISPNGDGMNDYWDLTELSSYTNNTIKIFNRYGTLVFEQRGYTNQFVGRGNVSNSLGEGQLPEGTYFYVIDLGDNNVDKKVYNGYVQIKR